MARLILHVGTHKTATTTIQKSFHANRQLLARHGLTYPDIGRTAGHHGLVTDWVNLPPVFHLSEGSEAAWKKLVAQATKHDQAVFLSSEEFSRGHPNSRVDLAAIRSWLDPFEEIKVICTLRDQVSFLQSIYLEISKKKAPPYWGAFLKSALTKGYGAGLFLNYCVLDDHLRSAFAEDEIHYVDYAAACQEPGIRAHILRLAGCEMDSTLLQDTQETRQANVSPDPLSAWIAGMIARPGIADDALMELVRDKLANSFDEGRPTTLYIRSEIQQLRKCVTPWNEEFLERLARRQPGFHLTPTKMPDNTAYRSDLKTSFWVNLTQSLYNRDTHNTGPRP
ncbi:MAG: hypothetical protein AAF216_01285 [Pseudomonadota bacterium]